MRGFEITIKRKVTFLVGEYFMKITEIAKATCLCAALTVALILWTHSGALAQANNSDTPQGTTPPLPPVLTAPQTPAPQASSSEATPAVEEEMETGQNDPSVLQRLSLDDFILAAIVVSNNPDNNVAMLEYNGVGYMVYKGSVIGNRNAVVKEIKATSIVIEEPSPNGASYGSNTFEISLPK
jgi:Tfp pilus assembly protein PilP